MESVSTVTGCSAYMPIQNVRAREVKINFLFILNLFYTDINYYLLITYKFIRCNSGKATPNKVKVSSQKTCINSPHSCATGASPFTGNILHNSKFT